MKKIIRVRIFLIAAALGLLFYILLGYFALKYDENLSNSRTFDSRVWIKSKGKTSCIRGRMIGDLLSNYLKPSGEVVGVVHILGKPDREFVSSVDPSIMYLEYKIGDCLFFKAETGEALYFKIQLATASYYSSIELQRN